MPVDHVNGTELYWERFGGGPRLLFCNGSGMTLHGIRPLLDSLAAGFEVLAWDYRGLGRSVPLKGPYAVADLAADAAGLLDLAGWDACRVFGVSFGGMVAQQFTVTHPERVERLVLACTSAGGEGGSSYPLTTLQGLPPGERAAAMRELVDGRWSERWLETHAADRALADGLLASGARQDEAAAAAQEAQLEARAGHDVWDRLHAITCPTLVGYGEHDGIAPPRNSAAIAARIPGAELRGYAGGHLFLFQDPAALPEIGAFLRAEPG
jgi:pimeloyl-ACP methyl ester carboxylesterase